VDGEIVFVGLPSSKKLQALLEEKLNPVN